MATNEQKRQAQTLAAEQNRLRGAYQAIKDSPALEHHLGWLVSQQDTYYQQAAAEITNIERKAMLLQSSVAYGTVIVQLRTMLAEPHTTK